MVRAMNKHLRVLGAAVLTAAALMCTPSAARASTDPGDLVTGAISTNPLANAVLVDTGALDLSANTQYACPTGGYWHVEVNISSSVAALFKIVILNASAVAVNTVGRAVPAFDSKDWTPSIAFKVPNGGKIQVQPNASVTGTVQATVFSAPVACY